MMETDTPEPGLPIHSRRRSVITTILVALIAVMIVRDILVRRWAGPQAAQRVTSRSSCDSERRLPAAHADA